MSFRKAMRRLAATAAVALVALLAAPSAASAAANPLVEPDRNVSLTIHKYLGATQNASTSPNNGLPLDESAFTQVSKLTGVVFDVYQVTGVDLTTNAGWEAAKALKDHAITATEIAARSITVGSTTYPLAGPTALTTNAGVATFNGKTGLYLVNENLEAAKAITDAAGKEIAKASITGTRPFLVTLPMTHPVERNTWVYDVHVYPKNSSDQITKDVLDGNTETADQNGYTIGQNLTYRLLSTVAPVGDVNGDGAVNGKDLGYYLVGDGLSTFVTYQSASVKLVTVDDRGFPAGDVANGTLTACTPSGPACDYWALAPATGASWQGVQIVFSTVGLNKLVAAQQVSWANLRVQTNIVAKLTSVPLDGLVPNKGSFVPSKPWWDQHHPDKPVTPPDGDTPPGTPPTPPDTPEIPGIPSNPVISKYGDIALHKTNDGKTVNLQGAEFALYRAGAPNVCTAADITGTPLAVAVPNGNGLYRFANLQLSNWVNDSHADNGALTQDKYRSYCVVETKAPDGYQLLAQPMMVNLLQPGTVEILNRAWSDINSSAAGAVAQVVNMPDNLQNKLPLTGAAGILTMSITGLVLVASGFGIYLLARRRQRNVTS